MRSRYHPIRKEAGLKIDPETAHVTFWWADALDPYGVGNLEPEYRGLSIGREYFARSPGSDMWVLFDDLPDATQKALWERQKRHKETWPTSENSHEPRDYHGDWSLTRING